MAITTFFGENQTPNFYVNGAPLTARNSFLAALSGSTAETFESFALNATAPLTVLGGAALTLTGASGSGKINTIAAAIDGNGDTVYPGRFNTTGATAAMVDGAWWETNRSWKLTFRAAIGAFGLYITDQGEGLVSLVARLTDSAAGTTNLTIPVASTAANGTLAFWGFTDPGQTYTAVEFILTQAAVPVGQFDFLGFDDLLIAAPAQVIPPVNFWPAGCQAWPAGLPAR